MRFSVITPTLDRPGWLQRAAASVREQSFDDWEHIIVDVSDNPVPLDVYRGLARDRRVRYFHMPPADGPALDFQKALGLAMGDIVHPLADDDELAPDALAKADAAIGGHAWLVGATELRDEHGRVYAYRGGSDDAVRQTASGDYMLGGAVYWKRTLTDELGGFNAAYDGAADFDLYRRFIAHSEPKVVGDVLYLYNDHPGTDSRAHPDRQADAAARIRAGAA